MTKRFFAEGEKRIGGSNAGNYYYSRDHLGSIREVTDSTGALKAQYDYDAYGNAVVVSGNMNVDFGFTGHYFHQPSGMYLAKYRAYNPSLGRWLSRDTLRNAELIEGPNLYAYVHNDPINDFDPDGRVGTITILYQKGNVVGPVYSEGTGYDPNFAFDCPKCKLNCVYMETGYNSRVDFFGPDNSLHRLGSLSSFTYCDERPDCIMRKGPLAGSPITG